MLQAPALIDSLRKDSLLEASQVRRMKHPYLYAIAELRNKGREQRST